MTFKIKLSSIITQLLIAFSLIILIIIASNSFVYWISNKIKADFGQLTTNAMPLINSSANLKIGILESVKSLEEQIITGDENDAQVKAVQSRIEAWGTIDDSFMQLQDIAIKTGFPTSKLDELKQLLEDMRAEQIAISTIANTADNEPAVKLIVNRAIPLVESMSALMSKIIELEYEQNGEDEYDEDNFTLLKLLGDSKSDFGVAVSELRSFLLTRKQQSVDNFDQAWLRNTDAYVEIEEDYAELFSEEQEALWQSYAEDREKLAPITIQAFELQKSNEANFAKYHLATYVKPLAEKIFSQLDTLNKHVKNVSDAVTKDMDDSIDNMHLSLILASIISILIASIISITFSNKLHTRVEALLSRANKLAEGSFERDKAGKLDKPNSGDEFARLARRFNKMTKALSTSILSVKQQSRKVGHSAHQVAALASDISEAAKEESASYSQVMQVTETFMDLMLELNQTVEQSNAALDQTTDQANQGVQTVSSSIQEMDNTVTVVQTASKEVQDLHQASEQISSVTSAISDVADQTALIALNAAIEAARAGEQGKGFAVVADEVRNLAQRTANSTDEIREVMKTLMQKVTDVINLMNNIISQVDVNKQKADESGNALKAMIDTIKQLSLANESITSRASQQTNQMMELQGKLQQLFTSLTQNAEKAQIVSLIGSDLYQTSEHVNNKLAGFKFGAIKSTIKEGDDDAHPISARVRVGIRQAGSTYYTVTHDISASSVGIILNSSLHQTLAVGDDATLAIYLPQASYQKYIDQSPLEIPATVTEESEQDIDHTYYKIDVKPDSPRQKEQLNNLLTFFSE
ncbi:methyl-accepting chemotaxis protein [Flocculibacter collagenilyticus]|uniref:methyl-accepting chemotaxis protein n=1 Tax=Flocculibacter collagenilyticus TaxID=2744479 RepID=UPI0018F48C8D|nr:methyl-accepting chemotaxis protein [Flocculibacter collagenilyticus]